MKLQKPISLILALVLLFSMVPLQAAALTESSEAQTVTKQITVSKGESVSVWNTDIAQNAVESNKITVQAAEGSSYDVVFAQDAETAAAFAYCTHSFEYETTDYIKPIADAADGMLVSLFVRSGTVTLTVESIGSSVSSPLTAYSEDSSPLDYTFLEKDQAADTVLTDRCGLSNISIVMLGTADAELRRVIDEDGQNYDVYRFTNTAIFVDSYTDGAKTGTRSLANSFFTAVDLELYSGALLVIPASDSLNRAGKMKVTKGSVIYASPKIISRDPSKQISLSPCSDSPDPDGTATLNLPNADNNPNRATTDDAVQVVDYMIPGGGITGSKSTTLISKDRTNEMIADYLETAGENGSHDGLNVEGFGEMFGVIDILNGTVVFGGNHVGIWADQDDMGSEAPLFDFGNNVSGGIDNDYHVTDLYRAISEANDGTSTCIYSNGTNPFQLSSEHSIPVIGGTADKWYATDNETVTVTAIISEGMRFVEWQSNSVTLDDPASSTSSFTVSSGDPEDIVVKAVCEKIKYTLTSSATEGGGITSDKSKAEMGDEVRVTVTPDAGYAITSVSANGGEITLTPSETETGVYTFKMPANDVTLNATFTKTPHTVTTSAQRGTLTADVQSAVAGDTVTLTLAPQNSGDILGSLSVRSDGADVPTTKINDATYTFTMPANDVTAEAVFVSYYCVIFENWDGEVLGWNDLYTNQTPEYTGETPVREANERYSFNFAGWDKELAPVSGDEHYISYKATYTATPRSYEIKFVGANDVVLQSDTLEYGATPSYTGETPTKATDDKYVYTFAGWDKPIATVAGKATYTATFSTVPVIHTGLNYFKLESYATQVNPFTPEESGYYRFYTSGDEVYESFGITDGAGDAVECVSGGYDPERNFHFEFVAQLEAGENYDLTLNSYSRVGTITLSVRKVDMYTVHCDQNTPHGTVMDPDEPTFMAYNGEKFYPYATPDDGYGLVTLTVTDASGKRLLAEADGWYIMPASDVYVTATFGTAYTTDVDITENVVSYITNEAVFDDWTSGDLEQRAAAGVNVEFSFNWEAGYILDEFSITTASGEEVEFGSFRQYLNTMEVWFTMPAEPITVTAKVAPAVELTFNPGEIGGTAYKAAFKEGSQIALPSCPFDAQDKEFAGWSVSVGDGDAILMAPGEKVTMTANATTTAVWVDLIRGDADGNGTVDINDVTLIQRVLVGLDDDPYGKITIRGDVDGNGELTIRDATLIQMYVAGIITDFT